MLHTTVRLEAAPFQNKRCSSFSPDCEAVVNFVEICGATEGAPFQSVGYIECFSNLLVRLSFAGFFHGHGHVDRDRAYDLDERV